MEDNKLNTIKSTKLVLTNQNQLCLTGISRVVASTENSLCLIINNQTVNIDAQKLTVKKLDVENGVLEAEGTITAIRYANSKQKSNFVKRIFG